MVHDPDQDDYQVPYDFSKDGVETFPTNLLTLPVPRGTSVPKDYIQNKCWITWCAAVIFFRIISKKESLDLRKSALEKNLTGSEKIALKTLHLTDFESPDML